MKIIIYNVEDYCSKNQILHLSLDLALLTVYCLTVSHLTVSHDPQRYSLLISVGDILEDHLSSLTKSCSLSSNKSPRIEPTENNL